MLEAPHEARYVLADTDGRVDPALDTWTVGLALAVFYLPLEREGVVAVPQPEECVYTPRFKPGSVARAARNVAVMFSQTPPEIVGDTDVTARGILARDENVHERLLKCHAGAAFAGLFVFCRLDWPFSGLRTCCLRRAH